MKKNTFITLSLIILALIVVGVAIAFSFMPSGGTVGSSVLGLQQVEHFSSSSECFDSEGDNKNTKLWLYTLRGGGSGQWAEGVITPNKVNNKYNGEDSDLPTKTLKIDSKYEQFCEYPIKRDYSATPIYTLSEPVEWGFSTCSEQDAIDHCGGTLRYYGRYSTPFSCWCLKEVKKTGAIGSTSNFNNPSKRTDWEIEVEVDGDKDTESFSSSGRIRGKIGENVCSVFQGTLGTGDVCDLTSENVLPIYTDGTWKLAQREKYTNYKIEYSSFYSAVESHCWGWTDKNCINEVKNKVNNKAMEVLNSRVKTGTIDEPSRESGAKIIKKLSTFQDYPVLSLYVRADWLGVVTPIPDPKIKEIFSECFGSGRQGTIKVKIKNEGNERGEVDIYAECDNEFHVERKSVSFNAGDEKTIYLKISGTTDSEKLKGNCKVYADAIENIDDANVEVCVTGHATCTKGEEWCEDGNAWVCIDSIKPQIKENCKDKDMLCNYASNGTTFCAKEENWCLEHPEDPKCGSGECGYWVNWGFFKIPDIFCWINYFVNLFKKTFAIIIGFIGGLVSSTYSPLIIKTKTKKNKYILFGASFLVIGGLIGFLAYVYFWWIVLTIGVLLIIRPLIPNVKARFKGVRR